jgi:hypothetical protein
MSIPTAHRRKERKISWIQIIFPASLRGQVGKMALDLVDGVRDELEVDVVVEVTLFVAGDLYERWDCCVVVIQGKRIFKSER